MAKMHTRTKGRSGSTRPVKSNSTQWCDFSVDELTKIVVDLAKQGKSSSEVGIILRDTYGVADFKLVTGKKISQVMIENDVASRIPEDLYNLIVKALRLNKHISVNKKDVHNKRQLNLVESKIRRLVRYYKDAGRLPADWKYTLKAAELLITR
jgi:small subunit ribosomal protein S15